MIIFCGYRGIDPLRHAKHCTTANNMTVSWVKIFGTIFVGVFIMLLYKHLHEHYIIIHHHGYYVIHYHGYYVRLYTQFRTERKVVEGDDKLLLTETS